MSLVMDFLHGAEDIGKGVVSPFEYLAKTDIINPINELGAQFSGNQQEIQAAREKSNEELGLGANGENLAGGLKTFAGNAAQVGLDVAAPGIGHAAGEAASPLIEGATNAGGKVAGSITKGIVEGAAIGGPQGVAQGVSSDQPLSGKSLTMDFLKGAGEGAALGGAVGGVGAGIQAAKGAIKPAYAAGLPSDQFSPEDLQKMAQGENPKTIEKQLEPVTGPAVAQELAPTIAKTTDPNIVKNVIDNALNQKLAPATPDVTGMANPSPAPAPLPPTTPVSDINTPQQVAGQASSEEASLLQSGQQLSTSDINQQPFLNAPGETSTSQVNKLGAVTGMHDILNSGGSTDEAINHYMETTGAGYGEAKDSLNQLINQSGGGGSLDRSKINANLNPQYDKVNLPEANSKDAAVLNGKYAGTQVIENGKTAYKEMQQLDEHDLQLVRSLRGRDPATIINQANDPEQFAKVVQALKDYNDYTQAAGAKLGQDIPYKQNYGIRVPWLTPEERAGVTTDNTSNAAMPIKASYTKSANYKTFEEGINNGEVPRYENALQDLRADINIRAHDQSQLALAQGLENAYPNQVKIINDPSDPIPRGYQQLLIPGGDKIFMPSDIASDINHRALAEPVNSKALRAYDVANAVGKNLELGGGLFHSLNTVGTFVGQQLLSGNLFKNPGAVADVIKNTFSDKSLGDYWSANSKEGTFDAAHSNVDALNAIGSTAYKGDASADIGSPEDKGIVGKVSSIPGLKQIHQSIFERQIPTMQAEATLQKIKGLDVFGNAADREEAIKIAKSINQQYGNFDRDIQGLTYKQFQKASRFVLATGWQEGQIRTLMDAIAKGGTEGKLAREAVFGKALLFGGLATAGAAAGGDFKGMTPKQVALAIMNKAINPSFDIAGYKVGLPATQISNLAKPIEQTVTGYEKNGSLLTGAQNFANSHAAFLPAAAEEYAGNKNYQGNAIHGTDYYGRPISPVQTLENVASSVLPIPANQALQVATGKEGIGAAAANTAGLNTSPQYTPNYAPIAGQTYLAQLEQTPGVSPQRIKSATEFFDLLEQTSHTKNKTIQAADKAIVAGDQNKANQIIQSYNQKLIQTLAPWARDGGEQYLDNTMVQLLQSAVLSYGKATSNLNYTAKTNPTSIGVPIQALQNVPQTINGGR